MKKLFGFVHIEKAAGQTFTSLLEENLGIGHCRVKPRLRQRSPIFDKKDLSFVCKVNPFVKVISGHGVRPYSDLGESFDIRYITLLRDPVQRYLSHFQYWVEKLNRTIQFDEFLSDAAMNNFQTRKIAGCDDLEIAKSIIEDFYLVGVVEKFDDFLSILQCKLHPIPFCTRYEKKNVGSGRVVKQIVIEKYKERIISNNANDILLYKYAVDLFEKRKTNYCRLWPQDKLNHKKKKLFWKLFRNYYYAPLVTLRQAYYSFNSRI